ncbi:KpsF/GutQ family sugar-phosphate isomerase [bacterium]|nr:KpsF/GutQ family sugar-phosphate isomerase [bacterium]
MSVVPDRVKARLAAARDVLEIEAEALKSLAERVDETFSLAVEALVSVRGTVVVCGVGKSGIVARKIAATLASTGTPAFFLHPSEAAHGDLGSLSSRDVVLAVSKSGEGDELLRLVPAFRKLGIRFIVMTGSISSSLARDADIVLDTSVAREACPMDLVPTASTTAALALGDALAVAVLKEKEIDEGQFADFHPGGALGRRLRLTVADVMHTGGDLPVVGEDSLMREAVLEIAKKRLGVTTVVDEDGRLAGILTDGDLKRILMKHENILSVRVGDVMSKNPKTIPGDELVVRALEVMETLGSSPITSLVIVDADGAAVGVIHIHDCLQAVG